MSVLREVEDTDLEAVGRLTHAEGWGAPTERDWHWLWRENPAIDRALARGWVLVDGRSVVGFLANIAQEYQLGRRRLLAATAAGLVVAPAFRGSGLQLMLAHAQQRGVDLLFNTTAAPQVSKISEFLKFRRISQPGYDKSFYWVLRTGPFVRAALRKKGFGAGTSTAVGPLATLLVRAEASVRRRGPRRRSSGIEIETIRAEAIGPEFDALWQRKVAEGLRLLALRDARTLRWHFTDRGKSIAPFLVCARRQGEIVGYMAVVRQDASHLRLQRARVADIFVERDDPDTIEQLLHRASVEARDAGASMIEVVGFPAAVRHVMRSCRPLQLADRGWPFLYKTSDPCLQQTLAEEDAWYASLFDGDGSI